MIKAKIISEVVGSPQEHVDKTLQLLLDKIKERKNLQVKNEKMFSAQPMEKSSLFSGFLEYDIEIEQVNTLVDFCFDFMPSSIEIIEPDNLKMNASDISSLFNELMARLHQNDLFLRNLIVELKMIKKKYE